MKGSDTLSVIGLSIHFGSGAFSQWRMCPWKTNATMTPTRIAPSMMKRR